MDGERVKKAYAENQKQQRRTANERRLFELIEHMVATPFRRYFLAVLTLMLLAFSLLPWQ